MKMRASRTEPEMDSEGTHANDVRKNLLNWVKKWQFQGPGGKGWEKRSTRLALIQKGEVAERHRKRKR